MAKRKKSSGGDAFNLSKDDFEGGFKTAPGGTYKVRISPKSKIKPSKSNDGNNLEVRAFIRSGPHKGISFFDTIAPHVGWKIAQLVQALDLNMKKGTLQQLLKKIVNKDLRVILREEQFQGQTKNKVVQWLPDDGPTTSVDEDDLPDEFGEDFDDEEEELEDDEEWEDEDEEEWDEEEDEEFEEEDDEEWEEEDEEDEEEEDWEDELEDDEEEWEEEEDLEDEDEEEDEEEDWEEELDEEELDEDEPDDEPEEEPEPEPKKKRSKKKVKSSKSKKKGSSKKKKSSRKKK